MRLADVGVAAIGRVGGEMFALRRQVALPPRLRADEGFRIARPADLGLWGGGLGPALAAKVHDGCDDEDEECDDAYDYSCDAATAKTFGV